MANSQKQSRGMQNSPLFQLLSEIFCLLKLLSLRLVLGYCSANWGPAAPGAGCTCGTGFYSWREAWQDTATPQQISRKTVLVCPAHFLSSCSHWPEAELGQRNLSVLDLKKLENRWVETDPFCFSQLSFPLVEGKVFIFLFYSIFQTAGFLNHFVQINSNK